MYAITYINSPASSHILSLKVPEIESTCFPKSTELQGQPSATVSTAWQDCPPLWSIPWYSMSMSHHWSPLNQFLTIDINGRRVVVACWGDHNRILWQSCHMFLNAFLWFLFLFASFLRPAWQHRTLRPSGTCHSQCLTKRKTHRGATMRQVLRWQKRWEWLWWLPSKDIKSVILKLEEALGLAA